MSARGYVISRPMGPTYGGSRRIKSVVPEFLALRGNGSWAALGARPRIAGGGGGRKPGIANVHRRIFENTRGGWSGRRPGPWGPLPLARRRATGDGRGGARSEVFKMSGGDSRPVTVLRLPCARESLEPCSAHAFLRELSPLLREGRLPTVDGFPGVIRPQAGYGLKYGLTKRLTW